MYKKLKALLKNAFLEQWSPHKLALSGACGFYIAFSPFPAGHTIMMIVFNIILKLNFPVLLITTSINNPFTAVPFFTLDYLFGYWFLHKFLDIHPAWQLPLWPIASDQQVCVWSFLVGGNVLGIIAFLMSYPLLLLFIKKLPTDHSHNPTVPS